MNEAYGTLEETADKLAYGAEKQAALNKLDGAKGHASNIADEAKDAARDLRDAAKIGATAFQDAATSKARSTKLAAQGQFDSSRKDFESRVRREPLKYVGISFGVGLVIGWLLKD